MNSRDDSVLEDELTHVFGELISKEEVLVEKNIDRKVVARYLGFGAYSLFRFCDGYFELDLYLDLDWQEGLFSTLLPWMFVAYSKFFSTSFKTPLVEAGKFLGLGTVFYITGDILRRI